MFDAYGVSNTLAEHIMKQDYPEMGGLAIQIFCDSIHDGDTAKMALTLAKNPVSGGEHE